MYAFHFSALFFFSTVFHNKNMLSSRVSEKTVQGRDFKFRNQTFGQSFPWGKIVAFIRIALWQKLSKYLKESKEKILMGKNATEKSTARIKLFF